MNEAFTQDIKAFIHCTHGAQQEFFKQELENLKEVSCVPMREVFKEHEIKLFIAQGKPAKKDCYRNAAKLVDLFYDESRYVEGRVIVCGYPVDHAFVYARGKYVDPTLELCLNEDVTQNQYCSFFETDFVEMSQLLVAQGFYGNLFGVKFNESKFCKISK